MTISPPRVEGLARRKVRSFRERSRSDDWSNLLGCFRVFKRGFLRLDEYRDLCYPGSTRGGTSRGMTGSFAHFSTTLSTGSLMSTRIGVRGEG